MPNPKGSLNTRLNAVLTALMVLMLVAIVTAKAIGGTSALAQQGGRDELRSS
jgi:hypothetical protein